MTSNDPLVILLIEDSPTTTEMVRFWLEDDLSVPFDLISVVTLTEGIAILIDQDVDLIILDLNLPDSEGFDTFLKVRAQADEIPIVIMSGERDEKLALQTLREGAQDYIVKRGIEGENPLKRPILFALERTRHRQTTQKLKRAQSQLDVAQIVQQKMLPKDSPEIPGFDVAGRCVAAETVAGDYFDFFPMSSNLWAVLIGDVSGHGLGPALHMIATRGALRALMTAFGDAATIMTRTNEIVCQDTSYGRFITLMLLMFDTDAVTLQYLSAGHPGYMFDAEGNLTRTLESAGLPVGIIDDLEYATHTVPLNYGDVVVLVTDGVTETQANDKTQFGDEQFVATIRQHIAKPAAEIVEEILAARRTFHGGGVAQDDLTVVVVKCLAAHDSTIAHGRFDASLPAEP